jgi:hypothetical protein
MRFRVLRGSAVALIFLTLFTPAVLRAAPAGTGEPAAVRASGSFLEQVRSVLSALWATLNGDNGSGVDPSGAQATGDNGSIADPSGRS